MFNFSWSNKGVIDSVRFISNPSSGKMGYALASGVTKEVILALVSGPVQLDKIEDINTLCRKCKGNGIRDEQSF